MHLEIPFENSSAFPTHIKGIFVSKIYFVTQNNFLKGWEYFISKGKMLWSSIINEHNIFVNCRNRQSSHKKLNLACCSYVWRTFELSLPILLLLVAFFCKMIANAIIVAISFLLQLFILELPIIYTPFKFPINTLNN
jgi:hypothetical protein